MSGFAKVLFKRIFNKSYNHLHQGFGSEKTEHWIRNSKKFKKDYLIKVSIIISREYDLVTWFLCNVKCIKKKFLPLYLRLMVLSTEQKRNQMLMLHCHFQIILVVVGGCEKIWEGVLYFHVLLHFNEAIFRILLREYMRCPPPPYDLKQFK